MIRVASYTFQSLFAERWRQGRVFLAGDAAHQMPPFLAQGLCSGFRDAHNLAWKLDLVLKRDAAPALLDTYMAERGPNARATIIESMRVGRYVNERDPEKVRARDEALAALQAAKAKEPANPQLIAFRVPGFEAGFIASGDAGCVRGAGDAFLQGRVRWGGREGRFDDVVGRGFMIIVRGGCRGLQLSAEDRRFWERLGGSMIKIGNAEEEMADFEGRYTRLIAEYGCDVIVKRPDFYIFGACGAGELPALLADLRRRLAGE